MPFEHLGGWFFGDRVNWRTDFLFWFILACILGMTGTHHPFWPWNSILVVSGFCLFMYYLVVLRTIHRYLIHHWNSFSEITDQLLRVQLPLISCTVINLVHLGGGISHPYLISLKCSPFLASVILGAEPSTPWWILLRGESVCPESPSLTFQAWHQHQCGPISHTSHGMLICMSHHHYKHRVCQKLIPRSHPKSAAPLDTLASVHCNIYHSHNDPGSGMYWAPAVCQALRSWVARRESGDKEGGLNCRFLFLETWCNGGKTLFEKRKG